jgi:hypothetical protein
VTPATSAGRAFRGTHGDGTVPAGQPGAEIRRGGTGFNANTTGFDTAPADWPPEQRSIREGTDGVGQRGYDHNPVSDRTRAVIPYHFRHQMSGWRAVRTATAGTQPTKASPKPAVTVVRADTPPPEPARTDTGKITNVRWEAGTEQYSHVTFDLSWENSWRAAWTEAAERNVTGAPLKVESWDAAWVFVKYRPQGGGGFLPATLSPDAAHHAMPAGAASAVGRSDDGKKGVGAFIYRSAVGHGPNTLRNVRLRWLHGVDKADPGKVSLAAHAIDWETTDPKILRITGDVTQESSRLFSDLFFDVFTWQLDHLGTDVANFGKRMLRTFMDILADEATKGLLSLLGVGSSQGGILGGIKSLMGGTSGTGLLDIAKAIGFNCLENIPKGVILVMKPSSLVGEACPLVNP